MSFDVRPIEANSSALSVFGWKDHVLFWMYNSSAAAYFKHDKDGVLFSRLFNASSRGSEITTILKEGKTSPVSTLGDILEQEDGTVLMYDDVFFSQPRTFKSVGEYMSLYTREHSRERLSSVGSFAWSF